MELTVALRGSGSKKTLQDFDVKALLSNYRYASFGRRDPFHPSLNHTTPDTSIGKPNETGDKDREVHTSTGMRWLDQVSAKYDIVLTFVVVVLFCVCFFVPQKLPANRNPRNTHR